MLTFEYEADGVLEITADEVGLRELQAILGRLEADDHAHLMTEAWGGHGLTDDFPNPDLVPIHRVTISRVGDADRLGDVPGH